MDEIREPRHYTQGPIECIEAIDLMIGEESAIDYCRALAAKYLWRLPHKGEALEDAKKAQFYIERLVDMLDDADNG